MHSLITKHTTTETERSASNKCINITTTISVPSPIPPNDIMDGIIDSVIMLGPVNNHYTCHSSILARNYSNSISLRDDQYYFKHHDQLLSSMHYKEVKEVELRLCSNEHYSATSDKEFIDWFDNILHDGGKVYLVVGGRKQLVSREQINLTWHIAYMNDVSGMVIGRSNKEIADECAMNDCQYYLFDPFSVQAFKFVVES